MENQKKSRFLGTFMNIFGLLGHFGEIFLQKSRKIPAEYSRTGIFRAGIPSFSDSRLFSRNIKYQFYIFCCNILKKRPTCPGIIYSVNKFFCRF